MNQMTPAPTARANSILPIPGRRLNRHVVRLGLAILLLTPPQTFAAEANTTSSTAPTTRPINPTLKPVVEKLLPIISVLPKDTPSRRLAQSNVVPALVRAGDKQLAHDLLMAFKSKLEFELVGELSALYNGEVEDEPIQSLLKEMKFKANLGFIEGRIDGLAMTKQAKRIYDFTNELDDEFLKPTEVSAAALQLLPDEHLLDSVESSFKKKNFFRHTTQGVAWAAASDDRENLIDLCRAAAKEDDARVERLPGFAHDTNLEGVEAAAFIGYIQQGNLKCADAQAVILGDRLKQLEVEIKGNPQATFRVEDGRRQIVSAYLMYYAAKGDVAAVRKRLEQWPDNFRTEQREAYVLYAMARGGDLAGSRNLFGELTATTLRNEPELQACILGMISHAFHEAGDDKTAASLSVRAIKLMDAAGSGTEKVGAASAFLIGAIYGPDALMRYSGRGRYKWFPEH